MKILMLLLTFFSFSVFAHDEGHGPKISDAPRQGGVVSSVVLAKEAGLGIKAQMKFKAEIIRTQDGTVRVYFYDQKMNPLPPQTLDQKAKAVLISGKKGKKTEQNFDLQFKDDCFEGKSPTPLRKPYNIDVKVMSGKDELLVAFDNLD